MARGVRGGFVHGRQAVRAHGPEPWAEIDPRAKPVEFYRESHGRSPVDVHLVVQDLGGTVVTADERVGYRYTLADGLVRVMEV